MWKMIRVTAVIVIPLALLLSVAGPWIMRGYGESFVSGSTALVFSVCSAALYAMITPVGNLIAASGCMWIGFWMNTAWGAAMLLSSWSLVRWGAAGLAGARLVAYVLHAGWSFGFAVWLRNRRPRSVAGTSAGIPRT